MSLVKLSKCCSYRQQIPLSWLSRVASLPSRDLMIAKGVAVPAAISISRDFTDDSGCVWCVYARKHWSGAPSHLYSTLHIQKVKKEKKYLIRAIRATGGARATTRAVPPCSLSAVPRRGSLVSPCHEHPHCFEHFPPGHPSTFRPRDLPRGSHVTST